MAAFVLAPAGAAPAQVTVQSVPATPLAPAQAAPAQLVPAQAGSVQVAPVQVAPPQPAGAAPAGAVVRAGAPPEGADIAPGMPGIFSAAELAELKALYAAASEAEQEQLRAYYTDLGVDLEAALGIAAARNAQIQRGQQIAGAMRELDFARKPAAVLAARSKLGFGQVANPNPETAQPQDIARWLHLQTMAGEWGVLGEFLASRPAIESEPVYAATRACFPRRSSRSPTPLPASSSPGRCRPSARCCRPPPRSTAPGRCSRCSRAARAPSAPPRPRRAGAPSTCSWAPGSSAPRTSSSPRWTPRAPPATARR
jgi:hypothetical protein